jgi:hypothetical protein
MTRRKNTRLMEKAASHTEIRRDRSRSRPIPDGCVNYKNIRLVKKSGPSWRGCLGGAVKCIEMIDREGARHGHRNAVFHTLKPFGGGCVAREDAALKTKPRLDVRPPHHNVRSIVQEHAVRHMHSVLKSIKNSPRRRKSDVIAEVAMVKLLSLGRVRRDASVTNQANKRQKGSVPHSVSGQKANGRTSGGGAGREIVSIERDRTSRVRTDSSIPSGAAMIKGGISERRRLCAGNKDKGSPRK